MKTKLIAFALVLAAGFGIVACTDSGGNNSTRADQSVTNENLLNMQKTSPVPNFPYSQLRQNLVDLETAQANTTQTTSFFFNQGVQDPVQTCPSIGFPIPSTDQLTSPDQVVNSRNNNSQVVAQAEATGVYTGNSTGTYVICVDAQGQAYADYWEGFVQTVTGPAVWNASKHSVELTGPPSFDFKEGQK